MNWTGLDWIQLFEQQLDWIGFAFLSNGFGLHWTVSNESISYSGVNDSSAPCLKTE